MKSLERFGTIAFDPRFIELHIGFYSLRIDEDGRTRKIASPNSLNLYPWLDFVPAPYLEEVQQCAQTIADRFHNKRATRQMAKLFAAELSAIIFASVAPRTP
jgi:hypothetical protein